MIIAGIILSRQDANEIQEIARNSVVGIRFKKLGFISSHLQGD